MYKYLFITYGEPGWRGVQVRALRMAAYLPKNEVIFWNLYDSTFIEKAGFAVSTFQGSVTDPNNIIFPKGIDVVIFADLPSNEFFNFSVFIAAKKQNIKIVICEQIYRRSQFSESVYKRFIDQSDLLLANGISYFKSEETEKVKIVPPQIEIELQPEMKEEMLNKYDIPSDSLILLGVGYHPTISEKIISITKEVSKQNPHVVTIITGGSPNATIHREGNLIFLPYIMGDEYFKLLYTADLVMTKFGYLQIIEALALGVPVMVLGEGGWTLRTPDKIDPILQSTIRFETEVSETTHTFIRQFVMDSDFRKRMKDKVSKIHDRSLFGAKIAIEEIRHLSDKMTYAPPKEIKKLAILINNEIYEKSNWLEKEIAYPLCIITGTPEQINSKKLVPHEILIKKMNELMGSKTSELLPHSFKHIVLFSERRLDGFVDILPWYDVWLEQIKTLLEQADEIYITTQGEGVLHGLLINHTNKIRNFS